MAYYFLSSLATRTESLRQENKTCANKIVPDQTVPSLTRNYLFALFTYDLLLK